MQSFQPSEIRKREVLQVFVILIPMGGGGGGYGAFCLKIGNSLTRRIFHYTAIIFGLIIKSATNITCLEFLQFCQVSVFSCFNYLAFKVEFLVSFEQ